MKPGDFSLGGRQLFGFLLPGFLWIASAALFTSKETLPQLAKGVSSFGLTGWLVTLSASLIVGIATQATFLLPFGIAKLAFRWRIWPRSDRDKAFYVAAHEQLEANYKLADVSLPEFEPEAAANDWQSRRQIFVACKQVLIVRSSPLVAHLLEREIEMNVLGTLQVPLVLLVIALIQRADQIPALGFDFPTERWPAILWVTLLVVEVLLLVVFTRAHRDEAHTCLRGFLVQEAVHAQKVETVVPPTPLKRSNDGNGHTADTLNLEEAEAE